MRMGSDQFPQARFGPGFAYERAMQFNYNLERKIFIEINVLLMKL